MTSDNGTASERPVLLCFDGSDQAAHAIAEAGPLLNGGHALVLHVWEPMSRAMRRDTRIPWPGRLVAMEPEVDEAAAEQAHQLARRGVELAREAGFETEAVVSKADHGVWAAIAELAEQRGVRAIVLGSRGLSTPRPAGLGGVARDLLEHCRLPTIVVGLDGPRATAASG